MHNVSIRQHIVDRVVARRGDIHWFTELDPAKSALVVVDMQNTFCLPGAPGEVPTARDIVPAINEISGKLRSLGVPVFWILHTNTFADGYSDWEVFFNHVVRDDRIRGRMVESLSPETQKVWDDLIVEENDTVIYKNRYSAFASGASTLERVLRNRGVDTVLVGGTKTNVCCDSTARDAMMLDFKSVIVSDCCATLSDEEHLAALETFIQQFGDVMTSKEIIERMMNCIEGRMAAE
ncbi:MAG: isochorismatase family cysteine hydrolase [Pseudomonadota bacterium]|nr:isochorismatase family cysteine hydrolase [Pseudomonadota bacterium]